MWRESRYNFINHESPAQERNRLTDGASMASIVTLGRGQGSSRRRRNRGDPCRFKFCLLSGSSRQRTTTASSVVTRTQTLQYYLISYLDVLNIVGVYCHSEARIILSGCAYTEPYAVPIFFGAGKLSSLAKFSTAYLFPSTRPSQGAHQKEIQLLRDLDVYFCISPVWVRRHSEQNASHLSH
jgi:hypothetical protein